MILEIRNFKIKKFVFIVCELNTVRIHHLRTKYSLYPLSANYFYKSIYLLYLMLRSYIHR